MPNGTLIRGTAKMTTEKILNDLTKWLNTKEERDDLLAEEADKKEKESLENARMYFGDFN